MERFIASKNAEDQFWIANAFSKKGSANCIPALHHAFENVSDSDVLVFCLQAVANIDAANQTVSLIKIVNTKKDNYVRRLAITALINEPNIEALEPILERAKKILSKKASPKDIDYQGGYSELQACFMFLDLFKKSDERINEFFKWAKEKRMDYMDDPTRKWAKKNLKTK